MTTAISRCKSCASANLLELDAEICFHLPGPNRLKTAPVFVFRTVAVCLECGLLQSNLSTEDLRLLKDGALQAAGISTQGPTLVRTTQSAADELPTLNDGGQPLQ